MHGGISKSFGRNDHHNKTICYVQGHVPRSRSQPALKVCAFLIHVLPITSSCRVGFKNYLAEMFIVMRQCVACENCVPRSKVKVTADTLSVGIPELCSAHNFIPKIGVI